MAAIIDVADQETVVVIYGVEAAKALTDAGLAAIEEAETAALDAIATARTGAEDAIEAARVSALADITPLAQQAEDSASAAAASAAEVAGAVDVFVQRLDIEVDDDDGLDPGGWYFERSTPFDLRISRFVGQVIGGTGTVNVSVVDGSDVVYGPVALSTVRTVNAGLGFLIPAGSDPSFFFEDVTGSVTSVYAKIEGLPE